MPKPRYSHPDRVCVDCKQTKDAIEFLYNSDEIAIREPFFRTRCLSCHEAMRQRNRKIYPACLVCGYHFRNFAFMSQYRGYHLYHIKVCCKSCIPSFYRSSEAYQLSLLRQAMVLEYGEKSYVYGHQYKGSKQINHIGRTKDSKKRMRTYRQGWYKTISATHILQELPFGALQMEYEARWTLYAVKQGWKIDNFQRLSDARTRSPKIDSLRLQEVKRFAGAIDPLTAPFEVIRPAIGLTTGDHGDEPALARWYLYYTHSEHLLPVIQMGSLPF